MSVKSKKSCVQSQKAIDRPFAPAIMVKAKKIADQYQILLSKEDGYWLGRGFELPMTMADGKTPTECVKATREALTVTVAYLLENSKTPPSPASQGKRTEQVNIRLTTEEKSRLVLAAKNQGFAGLSEFARTKLFEAASA